MISRIVRKGLLMGVLLTIASIAAAAPSKDTLNVTADTSTPDGVVPTSPGGSPIWFYAFCVPSGGSLTQTFPIELQLVNTNNTAGDTTTAHFNAAGDLAGATSVPADQPLTDDGSTHTVDVTLSTGALADGNHAVNVQVSTSSPGSITQAHNTIHIEVVVGPQCASSPSICFITSSDFGELLDCNGDDVTGSTGGTFVILGSKKKNTVVSSTNPGQFYYNYLWTNTGDDRTIQINLARSGANSTGANSVHAMTFSTSGFTQDLASFQLVNVNGTPCGPDGPCTILVPGGQTLWVTWHLSYSGIGGSTSGISQSCPGNQTITATGTLLDASDSSPVDTCTSSATGYIVYTN